MCSDCEAYGLKKHGLTRSHCIEASSSYRPNYLPSGPIAARVIISRWCWAPVVGIEFRPTASHGCRKGFPVGGLGGLVVSKLDCGPTGRRFASISYLKLITFTYTPGCP